MRKFLVVALAMLLAGAADVSAQGLLKRLGKAVKKEVVTQVTTAVNGSGSGSYSQAEQPQQRVYEDLMNKQRSLYLNVPVLFPMPTVGYRII
jgi:hypothetical protein